MELTNLDVEKNNLLRLCGDDFLQTSGNSENLNGSFF